MIAALSVFITTPVFADAPDPPVATERTYTFDDGASYTYTRPTPFGWLKRGFTDLGPFARNTFATDNLANLGGLVAVTAVLVHYDQQIYDDVREFGRRRGISQSAVGSSVKELPHNFGNWMYFIGDGRVPIAIAGSFAGLGYARDDLRMMSTASQIAEVMVSTGVVCQGMKMLTGRETPEQRTEDGGHWHGPVGPREYLAHQNRFDAMPSGHLATAVAAMTVLAENYHEHETAIYSVGGVLMAMVSFEMVNNGVHWASDYPIGAAIGYSLGKLTARNNRRATGGADDAGVSFRLGLADGALQLQASARF